MNAPARGAENTALATTEQPAYGLAPTGIVGSTAMILNPEHMRQMMAVAEAMATAVVTVPKHLQGKPGDCLAVVMQATQWNMNPFAVAQKTHVVNGTLGYEAQLVHAALEATGAIKGTFKYEYRGTDTAFDCRVGAVCAGDEAITWNEWLSVSSVTTKNSPLWKTNPKQQMGYLQVKNWARAFKPGAILGVYTPDELATMPAKNMGPVDAVTPSVPAELVARAEAAASKGVAGYQEFWKSASHMDRSLLSEKSDHHERLKRVASDRDKSRTVDNAASPPAPTPSPAPAPTEAAAAATAPAGDGAPFQPTYAHVMDMMNKAVTDKNEVALDIAADWIGEVPDPEQRKELAAKYEELRAEITGGAKP